jgi:aldose 1-epimerase
MVCMSPKAAKPSLTVELQSPHSSSNQPAFPSTILRPGQTDTTKTVYRFSVK